MSYKFILSIFFSWELFSRSLFSRGIFFPTFIFRVILILICVSATVGVMAHPLDSIGIQLSEGKCFIKHQVENNQTLYAIGRRYKVLAKTLMEANPSAQKGVKVGDIILVPCVAKMMGIPQAGLADIITKDPISNSDKTKEVNDRPAVAVGDTKDTDHRKYHTVKKGETLFSIARKYNLSVVDLKKWNEISDGGVKVGSQLVVGEEMYTEIDAQKTQLKTDEKPELSASKTVEKNASGYDKTTETGLGEVYESEEGLSKHLALHRIVPIGTVVKVKNLENGSSVFVKVVGKLPEDADARVVIKVSKMALDRLDADKQFFKTEISYIPLN